MWLTLFFFCYNLLTNILITIFGYLLPALCSTKAIISHTSSPSSTRSSDDIQEWLTYWIVFILLNYLEIALNYLLYPLKFSLEFKFLIICYLTLPYTQGSYHILHKLILPYFIHYEKDIDSNITQITNNIFQYSLKVCQRILWNIIIGNDTTSLLTHTRAVQSFLGPEVQRILQRTLNLPQLNIPNTITEIDIEPKNQSKVNLYLFSLKNSQLILDLSISPSSHSSFSNFSSLSSNSNSSSFITCSCRLIGKFYLELKLHENKLLFVGNDPIQQQQLQQSKEILLKLSSHRKSSISSTTSPSYILSLLDIHSVQSVDIDEYETAADTPSRNTPSPSPSPSPSSSSSSSASPLSSIGITFITKEMREYLVSIKLSPLSEFSSTQPTSAEIIEIFSSLSNCFQILSSRSRGLVWKKLQILVLLLTKLDQLRRLEKAWRTWTSK